MTFPEFDKYVEEMFGELQKLKSTKGREYTEGSPDRFANFNKLAQELKIPRYKVWQVYFAKHLSSIYSYIDNGREFSEENIQGRIKDAVMYMLLLGGMIQASQDIAVPLFPITDRMPYPVEIGAKPQTLYPTTNNIDVRINNQEGIKHDSD